MGYLASQKQAKYHSMAAEYESKAAFQKLSKNLPKIWFRPKSQATFTRATHNAQAKHT